MNSFKISLESIQYANGLHMEIQEKFTDLFVSSGGPVEVAMLQDKDFQENGKKCIYLTPSESVIPQAISRIYSGVPSDLSPKEGLALLVGSANFIESL